MEQPRISVAMCTYNGEKYLREQLDSIAAQSILPAELVICDDGSKDQTIQIIQEFASTSVFPVRLHINQMQLGVACNFFKAIKLCRENWVMLCDQDDVWLKERVALFIQAINANRQVLVILSDAVLVDSEQKPMAQTLFQSYRLTRTECVWINQGLGLRVLARHLFATGAGMMVRRDFISSIPEPSDGFLHDEWIAWFACPYLFIIAAPTFNYRQHSNQVTGIDGRLNAQWKRFRQPKQNAIITIEQGMHRFQTLKSELAIGEGNQSKDTEALLQKKIEFLHKRNGLSDHLIKRVNAMACQIKWTNYWRYASGLRTIIKDLTGSGRL